MSAGPTHGHNNFLRKKVAFVLIDGIGDVSIPQLFSRTPLEAANVRYLDAVADAGYNGLMDPVEPGLACGSDTSHLSIFGYDPRTIYRGRGAFESMGAGLPMQPGDIAFKSNFATLDISGKFVVKRRADRRFEEIGPVLCQELDGLILPSFPQHAVSVQYATEHRCGVVVRGPGLTDQVSGTDPLRDNLPLQVSCPLDDSPEAVHTAAVVNELSSVIQSILQEHPINRQRTADGKSPANAVLLRGCGSRIAVQPFHERHGMKACMVAPTKIIAGLGMSLGIDVLNVQGCTGDYRTQFHKKAKSISQALIAGGYDFGFLHVKAVDDTGHDRLVNMKVEYNAVVNQMVGQLVRLLWEAEQEGESRFCIALTGDHSTPVEFGDHSHEPVPFAIAHVSDVAASLGGGDAMAAIQLGPIPHPHDPQRGEQGKLPSAGQLQGNNSVVVTNSSSQLPSITPCELIPALAALQAHNTKSGNSAPTSVGHNDEDASALSKEKQQTSARTCLGKEHTRHVNSMGSCKDVVNARWGDSVHKFSEVDAAGGDLGRFPGSQVMSLIRQFVGLQICT